MPQVETRLFFLHNKPRSNIDLVGLVIGFIPMHGVRSLVCWLAAFLTFLTHDNELVVLLQIDCLLAEVRLFCVVA